jgi:hypothetical protein
VWHARPGIVWSLPTRNCRRQGSRSIFHLYHARRSGDISFRDIVVWFEWCRARNGLRSKLAAVNGQIHGLTMEALGAARREATISLSFWEERDGRFDKF